NGVFVKTQGFCTDVFFRQALGWIKQCKETDTPFFAYITPNAAHAPMVCPEKYKDYYRQHVAKDHPKFEELVAHYGMVENIDDNVGLLMAGLDEWGLADNTLLIYMTDNGASLG